MELMPLGKEERKEGGLPYLVSVVEQEDWLSLLAKCPELQGSALSTHIMQFLQTEGDSCNAQGMQY